MSFAPIQDAARHVRRSLRDEAGAGLVEYGMLAALIAVAAMVAVAFFGVELADLLQSSADALP